MIALLAAAAFAAPIEVSGLRAPYARVRSPVAADPTDGGDYGDLRVRDERGAEIPYALDPHGSGAAPLVVAARAASAGADDGTGMQRVTIDVPAPHLPIARLRFETKTDVFARSVFVERSDDGETWSPVARDRVARYPNGDVHLEVDTAGDRARFWRVTIDDRDDAPLAGLRVAALTRAHEVVFPVARGHRYLLTFGDPALEAPSYDLAELLSKDDAREQPAPTGALVKTVSAASGGERLPFPRVPRIPRRAALRALPAVAFGVAVAVLAWFALLLVRGANRGAPHPG
ncbi:MAG TPA: DUF3999 family protein [Candidatus Elarobacter sp.]|jgi:hypothetical protein